MRSTGPSLAAIAVLLAAAVALQVWRERGWTPYEPATPVMWLQRPEVVSRLALGFDALVADVYWIRAVVYYGRQRLASDEARNFDLLYPLLDMVTTLDPRFRAAYRFGAVFLSEPAPGGPDRPDLAIALLKRGWERTPERWEYPRDIAFVYGWRYRDYLQAADWFDRAADVPGAPFWLRSSAAAMLVKGGAREAARELWRQMHAGADNDLLRQTAQLRLAQFDAMDAIDELNRLSADYRRRTGRVPATWRELIGARLLRAVPLDPLGVPYALEADGAVTLDKASPLWPLPEGFESVVRP